MAEARFYDTMGSAVIVLDGDGYRLRFYSARGESFADIAAWSDPDEWQDLTLCVTLLEDHSLREPVTLEQQVSLLERRHETLCELFSEAGYPQTEERIRRLGRERSRLMFPGWFRSDEP